MRMWTRAVARSAFTVAFGCDIQAPEVPTYETQLTIPLSEQRKTMAELVDDLDGIVISEDDIRIDIGGDIDTVVLDDEMSVTASGTGFDTEVGTFDLSSDIGGDVVFVLDDLLPGTPTGTVIVPPFAFSAPERMLSGLDEMSSVTLESGTLVVDLTNELPMPAGGACGAPGILMIVRESFGGTIVASLSHGPELASGETVRMTGDLSGVSLTNTMSVEISGCSPGSGGGFVDLDPADGFALALALEGAVASAATAEIPAQSLATTGMTSWGDDMLLQDASVLSGGTTAQFQNDTPLPVTVDMRFPAFDSGGSPLTISFPLPAMGGDTVALDFSGVTFSAMPATNELSYEVDVTTPGSGGAQVTLSSTDAISVVVGDISLELDWLVGVPNTITQHFGPFSDPVEWPDDTEGVHPADATFAVDIASEMGVEVSGTLTLTASNDDGETETLSQPVSIAAGAVGSPVVTTITFDRSNSEIVDLLAIFPTTLTLSGSLDVGDGSATVRLDRGAGVSGTYMVSAPFAFTVTGGAIELEPVLLDVDEETKARILEDVSRVELVGDLTNGFPFGATATLMFAPLASDVYAAPELTLDPVSAPPADINPISGKAETASEANNSIELTDSDLSIFENETIHLGVRIDLEPSDGVVVLSASDQVIVSSYAVVDLTVSSNLFEGDE